jgi:RND superfamily putative drug exporter
LGIDHALFLAYRYREERRKGRNKIDAIAKSGATAGHAIFYAGLIVVVALFGIFMIPCNMHKSLALGAIIVVAVIAPASITLLPALLSLIGNHFDFGRLPWQKRITDIEQPKTEEARGFWHWLTRPAMKFTVVSLLLCAGIIIVCITPMFHMRLGYSYVDTLPPTCVSRSGYDAMIDAGYPSFLVAPLDIAIDGYDQPEVKAETDALIQRLDADGGFVTAVPLAVNDEGDVAWKRIFLNQDPFTAEASDKVKQLRNELIGDSFTSAGGEALVTGYGAFNNDFVAVTQSYTTPVLIFVLGLSLLLMLVAFRSILFAVVCTLFNLLSVYAAYGLVVFVFQDGHGLGLYKQIAGIDAYVPIFLLCGLFGISMDYFVFVLSRNRERYDQTGNMSEAIMFAFRRSGLVVLGAAAVMLVVFFAFSISQIVIVAELGLGLCVSLLIDATLITLVMSPATMKLLGRWFWWWPRWLNWVPDLRAKPASEEIDSDGVRQTVPEGIGYSPDAPAPAQTNWPAG